MNEILEELRTMLETAPEVFNPMGTILECAHSYEERIQAAPLSGGVLCGVVLWTHNPDLIAMLTEEEWNQLQIISGKLANGTALLADQPQTFARQLLSKIQYYVP